MKLLRRATYRCRYVAIASVLMAFCAALSIEWSTQALAAPTEIRGNVFADYNADGVDAGLTEHGIAGIQVQAFDEDNAPFGPAVTTDFAGDYVIPGLAAGQQVRLEFTIPDSMSYLQSGAAGAGSGTTVIFATEGEEGVNLGLNNPADFCQNNPSTFVPCFVLGAFDDANSGATALVSIPYEAQGNLQDQTDSLLDHEDIGTVFGLAHQRNSDSVYGAAYMKRLAGFGPGGADAIYQMAEDGTLLGSINLSTLAGAADVAGVDPHDFTLAAGESEPRDEASYSQVGKLGLGDIEISDDMNTLYVVNMFDRQIYVLDVSAGDISQATLTTTFATPDECGGVEHRPMGLAWHNGQLWVGSVCEDASNAHVHSIDPATGASTLETSVDLSYTRERVLDAGAVSTDFASTWNPWSDDPTQFEYTYTTEEIAFPQPLLSDIDFDGPNMILGFRDRFGDQVGYQALQVPEGQGTTEKPSDRLYAGDAVGDILRVCSVAGVWTLETGTAGDCSPDAGDVGPQPDSGPNGGEYYYWDNYPRLNDEPWTPAENIEHFETSQGGLLQLPGSGHILETAMDPFQSFSAGFLRLDNITGQRVGVSEDDEAGDQAELDPGGYTIYKSQAGDVGTFGKANGLGDIEALCDLAPLEVGNRVWLDDNGNGVQDPGEDGIDGVVVELYEGGTLVGTTTTANGGEYYFGGIGNANMSNDLPLLADTEYEIRIGLADAALAGASPTTQDYAGDATNSNLHDSDGDNGVLNAGFSTVAFTTGGPGENSHIYDFGFRSAAYDLALIKELAAGQPISSAVGAPIDYLITVKNQGDVNSGVFTVTDQIPAGMSFVSATGTDWDCPAAAGATGAIDCAFTGDLAPDTTTELTLVLQIDDAAQAPYWNWAEISADSSAGLGLSDVDSTPNTDTGNDDGPGTGLPPDDLFNNTNDIDYAGADDEDDNDFEPIDVILTQLVPGISLEKTVYAGLIADAGCPGQELVTAPAGTPIVYCFVVTNTGDTYLNDITLDDATLGITVADMTLVSGTQPLAPAATLVFAYESTLDTALINTANTSGNPTDENGVDIPNLTDPTDEDDAEVQPVVLTPAINLEKTVYAGHDGGAGCPGDELVTADQGSQVTYCFVVTNTGETYLSDITLDDPDLNITRADVTLLSGSEPISTTESLVFFYETTLDDSLLNTASTEGVPVTEDGTPIPNLTNPTDEDTAQVNVPGPAIQLDKTVYEGHNDGVGCSGQEFVEAQQGTNITYCFVVTNIGDTYLNEITLTDADLGIDRTDLIPASGVEPLAPGANLTFYYETTLTSNLLNTANTSGNPTDITGADIPGLTDPTDEDTAEVAVPALAPGISLSKTVYLGHDGGSSCAGSELASGSLGGPVTYCFVVTNTGDTYLNDIQVNDPDLNINQDDMTLLLGVFPLAPGANAVYYYDALLAGDLINTANTSGNPTDADGNDLPGLDDPTDEDDAEVRVVLAAIGDYVWLDNNANGVQDDDEIGLPGVIVTLFDENGQSVAVTTTDNLGAYIFDNLQPGTYSVGFQLPSANYAFSPQSATADDSLDSDADLVTGRTEPTLLTTGEVDLTWDAGIYGLPELTITKEANTTEITPDGKLIYTIRYANTGIGQANGVVVTESIPLYTRYVPEESSAFECANDSVAPGTSCTYSVGTIPPQSTGTLELVFVVVTDTVIPEGVETINNAVSIDDIIVGGTAVDSVIVNIDRPTAGNVIGEPDLVLPKAVFLPLLQ